MKNPNGIFLLIICALLFSACETAKVENASPSPLKTENSQTSGGGDPASDTNISAANSKPGEKPTPDGTNDFAGTAGTTDKKNSINAAAILREVRTAGHGNYDRVVFEFNGAEMPSYHIEYIDKPVRACGSGSVVALGGDGWLSVKFTPANAHTEDGKPTVKDRERSPNHKIIKQLKSTCDFEAEVEWVLGVAAPNKYRVLELKNPTRLAIDIKH